MTLEQMRRLHKQQPFEQFFIHLADGRSVRVGHPENLVFSGLGRTVVVFDGDDYEEIFDLLLVTSLRLVKRKPPAQNGG